MSIELTIHITIIEMATSSGVLGRLPVGMDGARSNRIEGGVGLLCLHRETEKA